jgi:ADP-heptose:LPS heptosyltransferase
VLLIRPDHLGDVLLASPAATLLQEALPDAQVDWLVGPWSAEIARGAGGTGTVLTLDFPGFGRRPKRSLLEPYRVLAREAVRLRRHSYGAALILRPDHWWGAMLAAAAGIPRRFGFSTPECQPFLTDTLPLPSGHAVRTNQDLARLAALRLGGAPPDDGAIAAPRYPVADDDAAFAARLLGRSEPRSGPIVAIHPGSGAPVKNWLPASWAEVCRALRASYGARIVLTGGPGEQALVESIADQLDCPPETLVDATTIGQLAALYARCDLVVGGDSGPLHLAAAVGVPTVRLYGPTDVREFGPWPLVESQVALVAGLPCQPCRNLLAPPCGVRELPPCMRALDASTVVAAAARLLRPAPSAAHVATTVEQS